MSDLAAAIVRELHARGWTSPQRAQDAHVIRESIGCSSVCFDRALVELTDREVVGALESNLYLRTDDPDVLRMLE